MCVFVAAGSLQTLASQQEGQPRDFDKNNLRHRPVDSALCPRIHGALSHHWVHNWHPVSVASVHWPLYPGKKVRGGGQCRVHMRRKHWHLPR